jgi:hypothetical protein
LRIVSRRNSPRKSKRPRKAASRATVVATRTFAHPHIGADPWPIGTTSADIDRPIGMTRAHPLEDDAHGMRDPRKDARYEIRIRGILGGMVAGAFPGLLARENHGETVLSGRLPDQAALHGVLAQIEALGLELIEIRRR